MRKLIPLFFLLVIGLVSCEPNNPFAQGPPYDLEGNLAIDRKKIDAYLDTAKIDSIYRIHDPSGIVIIVQEEGVGSRPVTNTVVYTDYIGKLMELGTVFDTSYEDVAKANNIFVEDRKYFPLSFVLGSATVIPGWDLAFRRIRPSSKAVLVIPSPYGYRSQSNNDRIPPNSVLVFEVDFLGID
ncbi:FKBP-type peptidyl-prolyl cis-trans isomerase [Algoriphagus sp. AK58]|uniref:FKBP-type peptidyl-prolyl cis-trans isomerase n=1 Tax=Algoriphagus sp. AK58 TaxID=1406877 RepID=UPI0016503814|nr:FKBP-type peptidyl-prolyl cis-trans isomerase [Algoriphagus sp. AK58]MBC6365525.1 FKBP-type peptidylprolyl isomerase [Algoriphagus sp. AK58]